MPRGNPILSRLAKLDRRVDEHEERLNDHDVELSEINADIALLADVCLRSHRRSAARLAKRRKARRVVT